jgi:spoIIIJ-associated protein
VADSIEISAKTVNEAVNLALQKLGKTQSEVDVTVISEGSRGILGIGAEDARVRVSVRPPPAKLPPVETQPAAKPAPAVTLPAPSKEVEEDRVPAPIARRAKAAAPRSEPAGAAPAPKPRSAQLPPRSPAAPSQEPESEITGVSPDVVAVAKEVVEELVRLLGLKAQVHMRGLEPRGVRSPDDGTATCTADIIGEDLGILIGRRGENLTALQYVTNMIVNKRTDSDVRVVVDVEHYLVRRYESLRGLALRMAERVKQSGTPITLEPMPPYERRIVHLTLSDHPDVSTVSIGEGEERRVVISAKK